MTESWKNWGKRFKILAKDGGKNLRYVAEQTNLAESTVRSWTNGQRKINLEDFFMICTAAGVDPAQVLFGKIGLSQEQKLKVGELVANMLEADAATHPQYSEMMRSLRRDMKRRQGR